jgi:hypothetical protein
MDNMERAGAARSEARVPTDLLASLLMERADATPAKHCEQDRLSAKIYALMVLTTLLTFATLATGYQILFAHQIFA